MRIPLALISALLYPTYVTVEIWVNTVLGRIHIQLLHTKEAYECTDTVKPV